MKSLVSVAAIFAAVFAFSSLTPAAADDFSVSADMNGDGVLDKATVAPVPGTDREQLLVVTVGRVSYVAHVPLSSSGGIQAPRVTDVDGDGRAELVVTESVGANTFGYTLWVLDHGLHHVTQPDGSPLRLWEGGGISAISRYGCEVAGGQRRLFTVGAQLVDWDNGVYVGTRDTYQLYDGGVVRMTSRANISGTRDAAALAADPATCA